MTETSIARRGFLKRSVAASAGLVAAPAVLGTLSRPAAAAGAGAPAFVDGYTTNVTANQTADSNAVVRILSGMSEIWKTGSAWNTGIPLQPEITTANVRYSERITKGRSKAEAKEAFLYDRRHQSYSVIAGLGPLAAAYRTGAKAVTGITTAPDTTPATAISDTLPAGAPAGSALGAGSYDSELGKVALLVDTVRGPFASSNPSKFAYQYPRPWRMNAANQAVDTGAVDSLGYPVYDSKVIVAEQLLRQRSLKPAEDGGYPSGHTNAFHLAALALAYAVPERFQELVAAAFHLSDTRIVCGMHSTLDVVSGRIMATALTAAALYDPANAELKAAARAQARAYFTGVTGTADLYAAAHSGDAADDPYADRHAQRRATRQRLTYVLPQRGPQPPMTVPKGAEVLLETRLPYLSAAQIREVLRTTALPGGYALLDNDEPWGRLDLWTAADGYGAFDSTVTVTMDAARGGFHAADTWRNDIKGTGGLTKYGSGTLTLSGDNRFRGGVRLAEGTLVATTPTALGSTSVTVVGGTLAITGDTVKLRDDYRQSAGTLSVTVTDQPALKIRGTATLSPTATLAVTTPSTTPADALLPILEADRIRGAFGSITINGSPATAEPTADGLSVRLS